MKRNAMFALLCFVLSVAVLPVAAFAEELPAEDIELEVITPQEDSVDIETAISLITGSEPDEPVQLFETEEEEPTQEEPAEPFKNGLCKDAGVWKYFRDGVFTGVTGLVKREDTKQWYYVENGIFKKSTGLVRNVENGKWCYVKKGRFTKVTGLVKNLVNHKWYYVKKGRKAKVTGLVRRVDNKQWYYVKKGKFTKYTGIVSRVSDGKLYYVKKGRLAKTYSGTYKDADGYAYRIKKGVVKNGAPVVSSLASSKYYTKNYRSRDAFTVKFIIIHHMAGRLTGAQCAQYFAGGSAETSANYCIGYDGDISCSVPENYSAFTSYNPDADKQAITIEVSDIGNDNWRIPKAAQNALVELMADIASRYPSFNGRIIYDTKDEARMDKIKKGKAGWESLKGNVLTHKWVALAPRSCPEWHMFRILPSLCRKADRLLP